MRHYNNHFKKYRFNHRLNLIKALSICSLFMLAGCDDAVSNSHLHQPIIDEFEVVDSLGRHTGTYSNAAILDPLIMHGHFALHWHILSDEDYTATVYINDTHTLSNAIELTHQHYNYSNYEDEIYCQYSEQDTLSCATSHAPSISYAISELISDYPESLIFILEVCDDYSGYCTQSKTYADFY